MAAEVKRLNYFNGQFLREPDFNDEQGYHLRHQRDHARLLHTAGIAGGLEIPDPLAGATGVTINAGVAYDDDGRRIVLADNHPVDLIDVAAGQAVYITIAYAEAETDPTDETGIPAKTRWTEAPLIEILNAPPGDPGQKLVLGQILRTGTTVTSVDRADRRAAGVKGGDLAVRSLMFTSDAIAPSSWVQAKLGGVNQAELGGSLRVTGNLVVTGTIQGDIFTGTVQPGDLAANAVGTANIAAGAVTMAKIAPNSVDGPRIINLAIGLGHLAANSVDGTKIVDGSIGLADLAPNSVDGTKIVDGSIGLADLAPNSVDGTKIVDGSITLADLAPNSVDGTKIVNGSVGLAKLAADSVDGSKIIGGSVNTSELADGGVINQKIAGGAVSTDKLDATARRQLLAGYVMFVGAGTIITSFGVVSVSRTGVGQYRINWTNTGPFGPYICQAHSGSSRAFLTGTTTNVCSIEVRDNASNALVDALVYVIAAPA